MNQKQDKEIAEIFLQVIEDEATNSILNKIEEIDEESTNSVFDKKIFHASINTSLHADSIDSNFLSN